MTDKILTLHNKCTHKDDSIIVEIIIQPVLEEFITEYWNKLNLQNKMKYRADYKQFNHFYNYLLLQRDYLKNKQLLDALNILKGWCDSILFKHNITCCSFYYGSLKIIDNETL